MSERKADFIDSIIVGANRLKDTDLSKVPMTEIQRIDWAIWSLIDDSEDED